MPTAPLLLAVSEVALVVIPVEPPVPETRSRLPAVMVPEEIEPALPVVRLTVPVPALIAAVAILPPTVALAMKVPPLRIPLLEMMVPPVMLGAAPAMLTVPLVVVPVVLIAPTLMP